MSAVTDILLAPDVRPFAVAAAIMVALGGIELLTMLVGFSISELVGKDVALETDSHNGLGGLFLWINAGRLPLLILIDPGARRVLDRGIPAARPRARRRHCRCRSRSPRIAAAAVSLPVIRVTSRGIARIIPRDETYAVNEADFVGHVAEVSIGPLDQGLPGRVRLKDVFGNWHSRRRHAPVPNPRRFRSAPACLLVDRDARSFIAISAPADLIAQQRSDRA